MIPAGLKAVLAPGSILFLLLLLLPGVSLLFFVLLTLDRPIARLTGALAVLEGIATAWGFGFLLLEGELAF